VAVDPTQVDQILANLCVNARDAIAGVGSVTIETGPVLADEAAVAAHHGATPGAYVCLSVSDDGCGMDADVQAHLFEPFFTTKPLGRGTGLGLATVFGIVKQNGGFIEVRSAPGEGTTFLIHLPRQEEPAEGGRKHVAEPRHAGRETVLLVEDESALLGMTTRILVEHGYVVLSAGSPGEALRKVEEHGQAVDLLVTDVIMPGMNGRDLAAQLRSRIPRLKLLFTSGYTDDVIAPHGVLEPGFAFLQKPFSVAGLTAKVREVLDQP
jgi:CheY-like chemotaxis protein